MLAMNDFHLDFSFVIRIICLNIIYSKTAKKFKIIPPF